MKKYNLFRYLIKSSILLLMTQTVWAHDPVFALGPHVLFKNGIELSSELKLEKKSSTKESELELTLAYGITGDWTIGMHMPYIREDDSQTVNEGIGDLKIFSKYRFWRNDTLGVQETASILLKIKTDKGNSKSSVSTGSTDTILGLTYGLESRKWYRWASVRYRINGKNDSNFKRGDKLLFDLVGGVRPKLSSYLEADTVLMLELNGEYTSPSELNNLELSNSGGTELFISPGIMWTKRNFAIKSGIQIPVYHNLKGDQIGTDYRIKFLFEWHL